MRLNWIRIKQKKQTISIITLIFIVIVAGVSLLFPQQYSSQAKLLIIQKQSPSLDAYLAAKAAEKIGNLFGEVIYSSSFFDQVWQAGFDIGTNWGNSDRERRKLWRSRVQISMVPQTSLLAVTAYAIDRNRAEQIAQAVVYVLTQHGDEYHGGGDSVVIKLVDKPITSRYPVRPNLLLNAVLAAIIGFVASIIFVSYSIDKKSDELSDGAKQPSVPSRPSGYLQYK